MPVDAAGAVVIVVVPPPRHVAVPSVNSGACDPPWSVDAAGIQRLRRECLDSVLEEPSVPVPAALPDCAPYWVDSSGIRRLRLECLPERKPTPKAVISPAEAAATNPSCDPPWYVDAKGVRRLRTNCL